MAALAAGSVAGCTTNVGAGDGQGPDAGGAGGTGPDAAAPEVVCSGDSCGGLVGSVHVSGFSRDQAGDILALLAELPASMTGGEPVLVERDHTDQSGCPDPTTQAAMRPCGLGWIDPVADSTTLRLGLFDQLMVDRPGRLRHTVTNALALIWMARHQDLALASMVGWPDCHPCPTAEGERCSALEAAQDIRSYGGPTTAYYGDFAQTVVAALESDLGRDYFYGDFTWVDRDGAACDPNDRVLWVNDALVGGNETGLSLVSLDIAALCGPSNDGAYVSVETDTSVEVPAWQIWLDAPGSEVFVEDFTISQAHSGGTSVEPRSDYIARVLSFSRAAAVRAVLNSCTCPGDPFHTYHDGDPTPVCGAGAGAGSIRAEARSTISAGKPTTRRSAMALRVVHGPGRRR